MGIQRMPTLLESTWAHYIVAIYRSVATSIGIYIKEYGEFCMKWSRPEGYRHKKAPIKGQRGKCINPVFGDTSVKKLS